MNRLLVAFALTFTCAAAFAQECKAPVLSHGMQVMRCHGVNAADFIAAFNRYSEWTLRMIEPAAASTRRYTGAVDLDIDSPALAPALRVWGLEIASRIEASPEILLRPVDFSQLPRLAPGQQVNVLNETCRWTARSESHIARVLDYDPVDGSVGLDTPLCGGTFLYREELTPASAAGAKQDI